MCALEVDQNTDGCIFGAEINDNGTDSRITMCYVGVGTSSRNERKNHSKSTGVSLMKNYEEAPEVDQDTSRKVDVITYPNELEMDTIKDRRDRFSKRE